MSIKGQTERLSEQHKLSHGEIGIFGENAKTHDSLVCRVSKATMAFLQNKYPRLKFRYRPSVNKEEINKALQEIDKELGVTLFFT